MKVKTILQKIGSFFMTVLGCIVMNVFISAIAWCLPFFLWALIGEDKDLPSIKQAAYWTAITAFGFMSFVEIIWYASKPKYV